MRYLDSEKLPESLKGTSFEKDMSNNHFIKMSILDQFLILPHFYIPFFNRISCWKKRKEMTRVFDKGQKNLQWDMNIFRVVSRLNYLIGLMKLMGKFDQRGIWLYNHGEKNVINCDHSSEGHQCSTEEKDDHKQLRRSLTLDVNKKLNTELMRKSTMKLRKQETFEMEK